MRIRPTVHLFALASMSWGAPAASAQTNPSEDMRSAFGAALGAMVYNTYVVIGSVGDGFTGEVYDAETVDAMMTEQMNMIDHLGGVLKEVNNEKEMPDAEDRTFLTAAAKALVKLRQYANALKVYCNSYDAADASAFEAARNAAWADVSRLLGLDEDGN